MNVHVACHKFRTRNPDLSPLECVTRLFVEHLLPCADIIVDPEDLRQKLREQNTTYQNLGDLRHVFAQHRKKLQKTFRKYGGANVDPQSRDDSSLDLEEVWLMCGDMQVYDQNLTKRGTVRPFAMSRDMNDPSDDVVLRWVPFVEFVMRIACIKFGDNELAVLAGRMHKDDRILDDDDGEADSIEGCMAQLMDLWYPPKGR